jgi:hypothetical protein
MYRPFAKVDRKLRVALSVALALSGAFAATDIPWHSLGVGAGISTFLAATAMLSLPYIALYSLLVRAKDFPCFQIISFVVVASPAIMLPAFRMSATPTGGWEYFIVPFWQLVLHAIMYYALKVLIALQQRNADGKAG